MLAQIRQASNFSDIVESLLSMIDSRVLIKLVRPVVLGIQILYTKGSMESRVYFNDTYAIEENKFCTWELLKRGWDHNFWTEISSTTPYPLFEHALKQNWITPREAMEVASKLNLKFKFIEVN